VAGEPFPPAKPGEEVNSIRAHVNGVPILDDEVREACIMQLRAARTDEQRVAIFNQTLDGLIDVEVVIQDLKAHLAKMRPSYWQKLKAAAAEEFDKRIDKMKKASQQMGVTLKTEQDVKKYLESLGMSFEALRRRNEREFMSTEYIRSRVFTHIENVSHEELVEYYRTHANQFQIADRVDWQDIFIDATHYRSRAEARQFAEALAARIRAGENFAGLAAQYGGDSIYRNGEGFGHLRGEIRPPEAEPILFQLQSGQVGPVIELSRGFHVIRLVTRQYAGVRPLDAKAQEEVRRTLQNEVLERESKRLIANLKSEAIIEKIPYKP